MASTNDTAPSSRHLRGFFLPHYATGHLIPLVDIAILLSTRGVDSTILATPSNADIVRVKVDGAASSGIPVRLLVYPFPSDAVGLPPGCENIAAIPVSEEYKINQAVSHVRETVEALLRCHRPDFIVSDTHFFWSAWAARDLGIPRLAFVPLGAFSIAAMFAALKQGMDKAVGDDVPFVLAGLPHPPIRVMKPELPPFVREGDERFEKAIHEAERASYGTVLNSFSALEQSYIDHNWKNGPGKVWCVGPVALFNGSTGSDGHNSGASGADKVDDSRITKYLDWLESQKPRSVVFICFGSWCHFTADQLHELALGLEESGQPFIWVVRDDGTQLSWLPEGYEARVEGKGLIIRNWAPQVLILNHPSVGAFLTHCGWNSLLEAVSAGVAMLTWPLVCEQFLNEKLVVDVLRIGSKVWDGFKSAVDEEKVLVPREAIANAVKGFMDGDREEIGRRVTEYREMARAAVGKGGSSDVDLDRMIEDVRGWHRLGGLTEP